MPSQEILSSYFIRTLPMKQEYQERLQEEFELIDRFGFTKVFEQVYKILVIARELKIPHIIRGSAGSSLVCFLMGITEIDPVLYGLELARFMNKGRQDLPDIDMDVPYNRREELYSRIGKTWSNCVARISNHVKYSEKVAIRESAKEVLLGSMPTQPLLRDKSEKKKLKDIQKRNFQLEKILPNEGEREEVKSKAAEKKGTLKHYSTHCGGIVIFEEEGEVPEELLLNKESDPEKPSTMVLRQIHLNKDETEDAGYIKIDILSNRALALLVEAQPESRALLDYPTRDTATERLFASGDTIGLTLGESRGIRKLFLSIKPRHMDDIAIALALIRPAAATRGRKAEFLERWKHGAELDNEPLKRQIIFDDDALVMVKAALDCDSAEADKWRKVFAKQNPAGRIEFRRKLIARGIPRSTQDHLMGELDYLALYSFCKSHAISYAQLVWALGYEKVHHPHRFWCAALNHCHSEYRKWVHYREARCSGLQLTREKGPYRLGMKKGQPALISLSAQGEQKLITEMFKVQTVSAEQDMDDMKQHGYWLSESFLPNCGVFPQTQQSLERWFGSRKAQNQTQVRFRGIIATGRILRRDGLVTLLTIGVENKRYIDIVLPDVARNDLFRFTLVEGTGLYEKKGRAESIQVQTIRGLSLTNLLELEKP